MSDHEKDDTQSTPPGEHNTTGTPDGSQDADTTSGGAPDDSDSGEDS